MMKFQVMMKFLSFHLTCKMRNCIYIQIIFKGVKFKNACDSLSKKDALHYI